MIRVLGESKSRLVKAVGAESCGESRNQKLHTAVVTKNFFLFHMLQNCTALWRKAHFQVKMYKTRQVRTTF